MAYTPINWQTGDTITAEKMNKMDNGWGVQETQLFSETVTTTDTGQGFSHGTLDYGGIINVGVISVTFDGTEYSCQRIQISENTYGYGELSGEMPSFAHYPFFISSSSTSAGNQVFTSTAGSHSIAVRANIVQVSSDFNDAVNKCVDADAIPLKCIDGETTIYAMQYSRQDERMMYFSDGQAFYFINDFVNAYDNPTAVRFYPTTTDFTAGFDANGIFTIYWS